MFSGCSPPRLLIVGATGWYGKTLVDEYIREYGYQSAVENLFLFASRPQLLRLEVDNRCYVFDVESLSKASCNSFDDYDGLVWYSFILKNKVAVFGVDDYRAANDSIASHVFSILRSNPNLRTTFFSSGVAYELNDCFSYEDDPYAYLKVAYEKALSRFCRLITIYPYATLGKYVSDCKSFAASSFVYQALSTGRIIIDAQMPVVRSYGSVHDFSRLLLKIYEIPDWAIVDVPTRIVPVTHTLDLNQLAHEVASAIDPSIEIITSIDLALPPSVYVSSDYSYGGQLSRFCISPSTITQQLREMSEGSIFGNDPLSGVSPKPVI